MKRTTDTAPADHQRGEHRDARSSCLSGCPGAWHQVHTGDNLARYQAAAPRQGAYGHGRYRYAVSAHKTKLNFEGKLRTIFRESVLSVDCAQNLVVLKTIEGMANGAAFTLDNMQDTDIVGTLAGDDTILLVFHDNANALDFCEQVKEMLR